jgi:trk system potassium uptake protein
VPGPFPGYRTTSARRSQPSQRTAGRSLILLVVGGTALGLGLTLLVCAGYATFDDGRAVAALELPGIACLLGGVPAVLAGQAGLRGASFFPPTAGFAAVALAWVLAAAVGAVPFLLADTLTSPLDAYFEAMSGFTTTGASLIDDLEPVPSGILLWRSITQWLGGIGIVVLLVAIAPVSSPAMQRAFFAESSGIKQDRLTPRIIDTAKIITWIYLALTFACLLAYAAAGMGLFDAVNHAATTIATGGFSTRTASIGGFDSVPIELAAIVFMALSGVNFAFYGSAIRGRALMPRFAEVRAYFLILLGATAVVTASVLLAGNVPGPAEALRQSAFSVTSLVTTTGYVTAEFDSWNQFARMALVMLMIVGGCAGSTAGGVKVVRFLLLAKAGWQEATRPTHPSKVQVLRLGGQALSEDLRRAVLGFLLVYAITFAAGVLAFAACQLDPVTSISATAATLSVVGPGLGEVGAFENYAAVPDFGRAVAIVLMLAGRLELFTIVALLAAAVGAFRRA